MTKRLLLKPYKEGFANYEILRLLWDEKTIVEYIELIKISNNVLQIYSIKNPSIFEKKKKTLANLIKRMNFDLKQRGYKIIHNRRKRGYVLRIFDNS